MSDLPIEDQNRPAGGSPPIDEPDMTNVAVPLHDTAPKAMSHEPERTGLASLSVEEATAALHTHRFDNGSAADNLAIPAPLRAALDPLIASLRWACVVFGVSFSAERAAEGDAAIIVALAMVLFQTVWRSFRPLRLGAQDNHYQLWPIFDGLIIGLAIGVSAGFNSPFFLLAILSASVASLGWGVFVATSTLGALAVGITITGITTNAGVNLGNQSSAALVGALFFIVVIVAVSRDRLLEVETRRRGMAGQLSTLVETNDLLHTLNRVGRSLPNSLDLRETLALTRTELSQSFDASAVALFVVDEQGENWTPQLADGCTFPASSTREKLHLNLRRALDEDRTILIANLSNGIAASSQTGLYTPLRTRGNVIGVLALEHTVSGGYTQREERIVNGLAESLALTVDNARWFRRLRALGAEEERTRIARDLHDRLGQWLTYISFELERIKMQAEPSKPEIENLHGDVQSAIDELRETLRQLRAEVSKDKPLSTVAKEHLDRFSERTEQTAQLTVTNPNAALSVTVETELLRILQEALNNIEKHAISTEVTVTWDVGTDYAVLTIADNGRGFDTDTGVRETAYGLVGMTERVDAIGATIDVASEPDKGTSIQIVIPRDSLGATK